jgi:hypothetical protein
MATLRIVGRAAGSLRFRPTTVDNVTTTGGSSELAHGFTRLVRQRHGAQLEDWITEACAGPISEIRGFANGLRKDFDAVKAELTSGGQAVYGVAAERPDSGGW